MILILHFQSKVYIFSVSIISKTNSKNWKSLGNVMVKQINIGSFILNVYVSWSVLNFNGEMALCLKIATCPSLGQNRVITF